MIGRFSSACLNGDDSNGSLAFDLEVAERLAFEAVLDLTPGIMGHRDAAWHRLAGHAGRNIYGVAPKRAPKFGRFPSDPCFP